MHLRRALIAALATILAPLALVASATGPATGADSTCGVGIKPGRQTLPVLSEGGTYQVLVVVPDGFRPGRRLPMVLNLHGATQSGAQSLNDSAFDVTADKYDFFLVSPDGGVPNLAVPASLPAGYFWNVPGIPMSGGAPPPPGSRNDERFLLDVLATMKARLCVNPRRIYVDGASNGAMMTSYMACHHADLFAAAGAVSGVRAGRANPDDPQQIDTDACRPVRPIPMIAIHGRKDPLVPYAGNDSAGWGYDVMTALRRWAKLNGCAGGKRTTTRRLTPTVERVTWGRCAADVALWRSDIGGHTWYGHQSVVPYELAVGETDMSMDNNEVLWGFFAKQRLPR